MPKKYFFAKTFAKKGANTLEQFTVEDQAEMARNLAKTVKTEQEDLNRSLRKRPRRTSPVYSQ